MVRVKFGNSVQDLCNTTALIVSTHARKVELSFRESELLIINRAKNGSFLVQKMSSINVNHIHYDATSDAIVFHTALTGAVLQSVPLENLQGIEVWL